MLNQLLLLRTPTRRPVARATALAAITLATAALLTWTPGMATAWNQSGAEATLWQLTNGDRVNNGVKPIQQNSTLVSIARWRSRDMIVNDYFSHNIPACNGCLVFHYYDTNGLSYSWGGENIGWNSGYSDADSPVAINKAFLLSTDHRSNILNPVWTHGGIGASGADSIVWGGKLRSPRIYTELFMQAKASAPAPTPKPTPKPTAKPAPKPTVRPTAAPTVRPTSAPSGPTTSPTASASATPTATPTPTASPLPIGASAVLKAGDPWQVPASYVARDPFARYPLGATVVASEYRIAAAVPADHGFFETVLGNLLGFFLG